MATAYIGEIRLVGFNFAPEGWAFCDGSLLSISENQALFALIGTTYGGDGQNTFGLPNLVARVPVHQGTGLSTYALGQAGGETSVTLTLQQLPAHQHAVSSRNSAGNATAASGSYVAATSPPVYAPPGGAYTAMGSIVGSAGGSNPHNNLQPYLAMNYIISLYGIFPSQN